MARQTDRATGVEHNTVNYKVSMALRQTKVTSDVNELTGPNNIGM